MSTKVLTQGNSHRTLQPAINVFGHCAEAEIMIVKAICELKDILYYPSNKFLATLAASTNLLLEMLPTWRAASSRRQKIVSLPKKYCFKRGTVFTHLDPPCTQRDLQMATLAPTGF
ncbi:hypothetical protein PHMEG_0004232 [Phytophthora megakarya]|uniref:Uncharacterized protein n=1 Tax=Phytophthora megakarya TaxID=4795 RepID=A0A225WU86_9STRA|nr:hypothetical protein PHMEG_0004232 [Phytophthora megakarya]